MVRIRTLGGLSVARDGAPLTGTASQPRRLAVLALVARAGQRGVTRERLLAMLWPDTDEAGGRSALSQALHVLRRELGVEDLFLGVQDLRLNEAVATCDVLEFEAALEDRDWERAVRSYGGHFLEGFRLGGAAELDRWIEEERSDLARRYAEALERLARAAAERGDPSGAVGWWHKRAALDPLNPRIAVQLMRALAAAGDRHAALQQGRIYEALVQQELALPPDAEVIRYAAELRTELAAQPATPPPAAPPATPPAEPLPADVPTSCVEETPALPTRSTRRRTVALAAIALVIVAGVLVGSVRARSSRAADSEVPLLAVGGIVDFRAGGDSGGAALADMLATNLARVSGIQVVSRARLLELVDRAGGRMESAADLSRAARSAGVHEMLEGGLHALNDGRLLLELRRVDLASGSVRTAYRLEGRDPFELVERATGDVAASFGRSGRSLDPGDVSTRSLVAYRFHEEGLRSFARGDYRGARRLFDAALGEDSTFAMAAFYRLRTAAALGITADSGEVDRLVRLAEKASDRERLLIQGWLAMGTNAPSLAQIAETLVVRYPAEVDAQFFAGYSRLGRGEYAEALPYLHRVLDMDSAAVGGSKAHCLACDALQQLVFAYHALDSLGRAEQIARDWTRRDSASATGWAALATMLVVSGRPEEAIAARRRATVTPYDAYDEVFPAIARIIAGDFPAADRSLRALRERSPSDEALREADWMLMLSLRYQARWGEALAVLHQSAAARDPGPVGSEQARLLRLAALLVLLESGDSVRARALADSLVRHTGIVPSAGALAQRQVLQHTLLAEAAALTGDTAAVARAADSAAVWAVRSMNPRHRKLARHAEGVLEMLRGDRARAIDRFRSAITSPTVGFTRTSLLLGRLLLEEGRAAEAIPVLRAALRGALESSNLYVTHTELHEVLARALVATGQPDSARPHLRYVVSALAQSDPGARPRLAAAEALLRR